MGETHWVYPFNFKLLVSILRSVLMFHFGEFTVEDNVIFYKDMEGLTGWITKHFYSALFLIYIKRMGFMCAVLQIIMAW